MGRYFLVFLLGVLHLTHLCSIKAHGAVELGVDNFDEAIQQVRRILYKEQEQVSLSCGLGRL